MGAEYISEMSIKQTHIWFEFCLCLFPSSEWSLRAMLRILWLTVTRPLLKSLWSSNTLQQHWCASVMSHEWVPAYFPLCFDNILMTVTSLAWDSPIYEQHLWAQLVLLFPIFLANEYHPGWKGYTTKMLLIFEIIVNEFWKNVGRERKAIVVVVRAINSKKYSLQ